MLPRIIRLLDDATINQIAAGEVIENPASVVKELVENSLDSGATDVCIETRAGGRGLIKVVDDGCGMGPDDLLLAVERHATSKLSEVSDLESLHTLGFRGEALPSIAAVSKFSLHSSSKGGEGALLQIEGGRMGPLQPLPRQRGTTIEVKSLFFNVPVRKKFQKSLGWDTAEIHKVLTKFALGFPAVGFSWINDDKVHVKAPRGEEACQRMRELLGEEWIEGSLPVEHAQNEIRLWGRISRPSLHRPNRSGQHLFINQRSVISPWVAGQVLQSYGTRLSAHRYPLFVLYLSLPPSWVDVNVHPQKREVRLREEGRLAPFILQAVTEALESRPVNHPESQLVHREMPELCEIPSFHEPASLYRPTPSAELFLFEEPAFSIVGKVKHYFFVEEAKGIRIVDGLRAMERIVYDQLQVEQGKQEVQALLIPIQLKMKGKELTLLQEHLEALNELGVSIRHFGGDTFLVDAIPAVLEPEEIPEWIEVYLEEGRIPLQMGRCLKRGALSLGSGTALVKKLFQCQNHHETPAGKQIHYLLDPQQLEKLLP
ncbi:DNA mismatch repair endonuclease MutL [Chlamydiota bacterium]